MKYRLIIVMYLLMSASTVYAQDSKDEGIKKDTTFDYAYCEYYWISSRKDTLIISLHYTNGGADLSVNISRSANKNHSDGHMDTVALVIRSLDSLIKKLCPTYNYQQRCTANRYKEFCHTRNVVDYKDSVFSSSVRYEEFLHRLFFSIRLANFSLKSPDIRASETIEILPRIIIIDGKIFHIENVSRRIISKAERKRTKNRGFIWKVINRQDTVT
jgi:hypothetical protein